MESLEKLIMMAEDELTQYSTDARKIEKLRQKIGLLVPPRDQKVLKDGLLAAMPKNGLDKILETQRQLVALPFWGIAGLGLLLGISLHQPLDLIGSAVAFPLAFLLQKRGWQLEAKRLLLTTLEQMEADRNSVSG
jgi:hypothetical protein